LRVIINGQIAWTGIHTGASGGTPGLGVYGDSIVDDFVASSATGTPPFHDDFNRTTIGANYNVATGAFAAPVLDGTVFTGTTNASSLALLSPAAATIPNDQFARITTVNLTKDGISSLFLRAALKPDGTDLESGYELDMGRLFDDSGDWWAIYYVDPVLGYQQIHVTYPSRVSIPEGSIVEFSATGNTLKLVINGQTAWTGTDPATTVGAPGIGVYGDAKMDDFYAGKL
jgi:hypothetical protein